MMLSPVNPEDYRNALAKLQGQTPIVRKQLLGLVGSTSEGGLVFIPGSYEKGYSNSMLPSNQRPRYVLNFGILGQLSDGTWVFPPSYDSGLSQGSVDLKFAILAEGERRLMHQIQELETTQARLMEELNQTSGKLERTREELGQLSVQKHSQTTER